MLINCAAIVGSASFASSLPIGSVAKNVRSDCTDTDVAFDSSISFCCFISFPHFYYMLDNFSVISNVTLHFDTAVHYTLQNSSFHPPKIPQRCTIQGLPVFLQWHGQYHLSVP